MKNITVHTGILELVKRLPQSANGNPRYLIRIDGHTARTQVDSSLSYSMPSYFGKRATVKIGTHYGIAQVDGFSIKDW
jgi:hypothetical protein